MGSFIATILGSRKPMTPSALDGIRLFARTLGAHSERSR
jgi:hypothetical protein